MSAHPGRAPRVDPDRLRQLLAARSVAIVGASDNSPWSAMVVGNFAEWEFAGELHLVNRRGAPAHGRETSTSVREVGRPVDLAILLVANAAIADALRDAASAGARGAVLLGAGFGETGAEGRELERQLAELAAELGITLVGPNGVGFANLLERVPAWVSPLPRRFLPGGVAVVTNSGNLGLTIGDFAASHGVGISHIISTGNEVNLDILDCVNCLLDDDRVRAFAVFAESIRDPGFFREIAAKAAALEKPIVMLKAGASELAARVAQTHTGALVGDDALIDAALRQAGVVRVASLEELVITAGLLSHTGKLPPGGLGMVSISGGSNDIVADRAEALGVPLPPFSEQTAARLGPTLEQLGVATLLNPFDVTGAAVGKYELLVEPLRVLADDPGIALVAYTGVPFLEAGPMVETYPWLGQGLQAAGRRGVLLTNILQPVTLSSEAVLERASVPYVLLGLEHGMLAIRHAFWWSAWLGRRRAGSAAPPAQLALAVEEMQGNWSEARALTLLAEHGVPASPWRVAASSEAAVEAARELGYPVVLKVHSAEIMHKSDVDGVALGLRTDDDVTAAYDRVRAAALAIAGVATDEVLVAGMRSGGRELIAGVVRDPHWGLSLVLGLGGVQAEALADTSLRLLPLEEPEIREMLDELRGKALLGEFRGEPGADLDRVAAVIACLCRVATALGPRLQAIEVNPLWVGGSTVAALDAVVSWSDS